MEFTCACCGAKYEVAFTALTVPEKKTPAVRGPKVTKKSFGQYGKVKLTDAEFTALLEAYGEFILDKTIMSMDRWLESKGKTYKRYKASIEMWIAKDLDSNPYLLEKLPKNKNQERKVKNWDE